MRRFVNDDAGYVAWLSEHPDGYVLNTYPHVTSDYLILHRAACRTINRPLAIGREWTRQYGKSCDDDRTVIERWASEQTGASVQPCAHCLPGDPARRPRASADSPPGGIAGGRRPRSLPEPITMDGEPITVTIDGVGGSPRFVIEGAQWLAETFFRRDPSATGPKSYDVRIAFTRRDPWLQDHIVDEDVTAVNTTMAARTGHETWAPIVGEPSLRWLEAIDPTWDLVAMSDDEWSERRVSIRLQDAFKSVQRKSIGIAVATKILHMKRPALIPVLDSLVLAQVGARQTDDVASWVAGTERVRAVGRANSQALDDIGVHLALRGIEGRSAVRILDALLWVSHPAAGFSASLVGWERVLRPHVHDAAAFGSRNSAA